MDLKIDQRLRELRRDRGNTQEELAQYLGISTQAVSKWERGGTAPDISLLPKIAAFYDVTVDSLLGVNEYKKQKLFEEARRKWQEYKAEGRYGDCLAVWDKVAENYPNDLGAAYHIMYSLHYINGSDTGRIISLGERILSESRDQRMREGAIHCLCIAYHRLGDDKTAQKYAEMAGSEHLTRGALLMTVLKGEERQEHCEKLFEIYLDKLGYLLRHSGWADERDRIRLKGFCAELKKLADEAESLCKI